MNSQWAKKWGPGSHVGSNNNGYANCTTFPILPVVHDIWITKQTNHMLTFVYRHLELHLMSDPKPAWVKTWGIITVAICTCWQSQINKCYLKYILYLHFLHPLHIICGHSYYAKCHQVPKKCSPNTDLISFIHVKI